MLRICGRAASGARTLKTAQRIALPLATAIYPRTYIRSFSTAGPSQSANSEIPPIRLHYADDFSSGTPTERLLSASLANVPELGWSYEALRRGAISLGYSSASHGLADRGPIELVEYFIRRSTREMSEEMKHMDLKSMRVTQTVRTACIMRMKMTTPYIKRWPEAVSLMMQPQNLPTTMSNLHELVDEIWFLAGDRSVDMNYYSKRTLLAGVYTSTEMFMTQDQSPDFAETWKFLDRRLQDTAFFGKTVNDAFSFVNFGLKSLDGLLVSKGLKR